jgi:hypothetical protein
VDKSQSGLECGASARATPGDGTGHTSPRSRAAFPRAFGFTFSAPACDGEAHQPAASDADR